MAQGDQTLREAYEERQRVWGELRAHCPGSFDRLDGFAVAWFADHHRDSFPGLAAIVGPIDRDGLDAAAEGVLAAVQHELSARSSPLPRHVATLFARSRFQAITALAYNHGERHAKRTLLRVAEPAPSLTVCMGNSFRIRGARQRPVASVFGALSFCVQGCYSIFAENETLSGNSMWTGRCPDCQSDRRKPERDQELALRKRIDTALKRPAVYVAFNDGPPSVERRPATY